MEKIIGNGSSTGFVCAKVVKLLEPVFDISSSKINETDKENEKQKVVSLFSKTVQEIKSLKEIAINKFGEKNAAVFEAHIDIVNDVSLLEQINNLIDTQLFNAVFAIREVYENTKKMFSQMEDEYFKERSSDIHDVMIRILSIALDEQVPNLLSISEPSIVLAHDLTPSQTVFIDTKLIRGIVTEIGGKTSHVAFIAQSMNIPAVLGAHEISKQVNNGEIIALDGSSGYVFIKLNDDEIETFNKKYKEFLKEKELLDKYKKINLVSTLDKKIVKLAANIGTTSDIKIVNDLNANGVGLFRTEFLYMQSSNWPSEDEQFNEYKTVLQEAKNQQVVIRTLDIGGDKNLNYYKFSPEMNPFLGYRAIRFCLGNEQIFKTQLRALLRASVYGKLCIMFPMISTVDEFLAAKQILLLERENLIKENIKVANDIEVGMMVEIPSTAMLIDKFAKYSDFFSVGSNDLIQYSFACDRMSEKVSYLYQPNNPSLLRMLKNIISDSHKYGKWVGMCGQMAGSTLSIPLLLGLGLDEFSVSTGLVLQTKKLLKNLKYRECKKLVKNALNMSTETEVNNLVENFLKNRMLN